MEGLHVSVSSKSSVTIIVTSQSLTFYFSRESLVDRCCCVISKMIPLEDLHTLPIPPELIELCISFT